MKPSSDTPSTSEASTRILEAAERLFAERGYDGVSIRDIAEAAGVSKANVFHHFANKWELYRAVINRCSDSFRELLEAHYASATSWHSLFDQFAELHLRRTLDYPSTTRLFLRQLLGDDIPEGRELLESNIERSFRLTLSIIQDYQKRGEIAADFDPSVLALTLLGSHLALFLLRGVLARSDDGQRTVDPGYYHQAVMKLLFNGIRPAQAPQSKEQPKA